MEQEENSPVCLPHRKPQATQPLRGELGVIAGTTRPQPLSSPDSTDSASLQSLSRCGPRGRQEYVKDLSVCVAGEGWKGSRRQSSVTPSAPDLLLIREFLFPRAESTLMIPNLLPLEHIL